MRSAVTMMRIFEMKMYYPMRRVRIVKIDALRIYDVEENREKDDKSYRYVEICG